ncbi:GSCOCG00006295001-RA-CDS [Cotesia congregata]|nr:GSCOCG00006295001-RA-CDS [Cotesia congregata]
MLPSTGYFKSITCPFYDNGSCDRPYCHFKHLRRGAATSTTTTATINSSTTALQLSSAISATDSQTIQQLVTEAVTKVLADQNVTNKEQVSETIVSKVVEGLKPSLTVGKHVGVPQLISKPPCVYNPTPIAELKKRHIAVPVYMPTRESKVAVKRKTSDDGVKPWLSCLPDSIKTKPSEITYKPTAINTINAINDSNKNKSSDNCYVPTAKGDSSTINYEDRSSEYIVSSSKSKKEAYCPKPKKRREEYVPKMVKAPLKSLEQLDDCAMDDFEPEFSMLDEILMTKMRILVREYQESDHPKGVTSKSDPKPDIEVEAEDVGKKRVAHALAASTVARSHLPSQPLKRLPNPQQRMYERWKLTREATTDKTKPPVTGDKDVFSSVVEKPHVNGTGRVRIAPVPYAKSLEQAKKKVLESVAKVPVEPKTVAQTRKGTRVAHIPQTVPQLIRSEPLQVTTQKFPLNIRQYYVNLMHDICIQIYTSGEDAAQRALREELNCHNRCKALTVYKSSCMVAAHRLRKEVEQNTCAGDDDSMPSGSGTVSHDAVLAGKSKGAKIYTINTRNQSIVSKVPNERYCSRCNKPYMVDKFGFAVQKQNCIYHWGRKFTIRGEGKYSCCQQYGSATGCADAQNHVWDKVDYENLRGYVQTLPRDISDENQGVYALDCEMCYTTQGLELTRVTVINDDCKTIYETLVKPDNRIIDYNTRFSGITEENMIGVTTTILDVQATLLSMFSEKTILIGHSLESDFKALKLIHNTVVDTSVVFPHKNGYPQKRALKNLCSEYLRKIIQNDVGGHDSSEDAIACMELMQWKVKEDAKLL